MRGRETGDTSNERASSFCLHSSHYYIPLITSGTHTHTRTHTYTLTAPGDGWRERRGEERSGAERRGEERGDGRDAALGAALRSPAAGWPERGAARTGMSPLIRLEQTVCRSVRC